MMTNQTDILLVLMMINLLSESKPLDEKFAKILSENILDLF